MTTKRKRPPKKKQVSEQFRELPNGVIVQVCDVCQTDVPFGAEYMDFERGILACPKCAQQ